MLTLHSYKHKGALLRRCFLYLAALFFLPHLAHSSPWLPAEGEYVYITSAYITDKISAKRLEEESKLYYAFQQDITALEKLKKKYNDNPKLTSQARANRIISIDQKILNLKKLQDNFSGYYPLLTASQSIEYGINDKYSLTFKAFSQLKKNFNKDRHSNLGFEIAPKIKLKQTEKYMLSFQPSIAVQRDGYDKNHLVGELRTLLGRVTKHKLGKAFNTIEIAPGFAQKSFECRMDYTTGLETKRGTILLLQTYNSFRPKAHKIYKQTSLEQFSIAKPFMINNYAHPCKITLQVGYFYEFSISTRKAITSGVQFSIWVQI